MQNLVYKAEVSLPKPLYNDIGELLPMLWANHATHNGENATSKSPLKTNKIMVLL